MVIDLILDRREDDRSGIFNYEPGKFYRECMEYGEVADDITESMDYGTEEQVKHAIKRYIVTQGYNPDICNYVDSVDWL